MEELIRILKGFDIRKNNWNEKWDDNAVAKCFRPCAEKILFNGYFLVNGEYIIDLGAIELYYHEEEGDIKDYAMYHIFDKNKSKIKEYEKGLPYFKFGSFNLHQSGVDVTFENEYEKYRASFLIRSYRVLKTEDGMYPQKDDTKYDPHSTHIFDDMFYRGISMNGMATEIVWIPTDRKQGHIETLERVNVVIYEKPNVKKIIELSDDVYNNNKSKYMKIDNKHHFFEKDLRRWRFQLKNN